MSGAFAPTVVEENHDVSDVFINVARPTGAITPRQVNLLADQFNATPEAVVQDLEANPLVDIPVEVSDKTVSNTVKVSNRVTDTTIPKAGQALLNVIAMYESAGDYNVIVGHGKAIKGAPGSFSSYEKHPRVIGMRTSHGPSTAAGRYQITAKTWDGLRKKYPQLTDFSPKRQDQAAWLLAQDDYKIRTGRNLLTDLETKNYQFVRKGLQSTWVGLVGQDIPKNLTTLMGE